MSAPTIDTQIRELLTGDGCTSTRDQAILAALDLHRPFRVFDECGHEHTAEDVQAGRAVNIQEIGYTCEAEGFQYVICGECCLDGEYQTEACGTDHARPCYPCPTVLAMAQAIGVVP